MDKKKQANKIDKKKLLLKPVAAWLIIAGILTIVTTAAVTFYFQVLASLTGFIALMFLMFLAAYEMTAFRSVWMAQIGEWTGIIRVLGVSVLVRGALLSLVYSGYDEGFVGAKQNYLDIFFILNVASILIEAIGLAFIFKNKRLFLPSDEEVEIVMKRLRAIGDTVVSQCPTCKLVVESDWCCCPSCGTELPRMCSACKAPIGSKDECCPACGAACSRSVAIQKTIKTMKENAELLALPETRSVRYARYAEALLKGGLVDEALQAYRSAISFTKFKRKQTNFMVKMATIYKNSGRQKDAAELLKSAIELDAEDVAGAKKALDLLFAPVEEKPKAVKA